MQRYGRSATRIRARVGEAFVLELPVRATAGYEWRVVRAPETARVSGARIRPGGTALGASAIQEFDLVATLPGAGTLVVACKRPWETAAGERLELTIVVER